MALRVRCKSKMQDAPLPYWPVSPMPCVQQQLPPEAFMPLPWQQQALAQPATTPNSGGGCDSPIIVQAPAQAAPIVIQSPPVFIPMQIAPATHGGKTYAAAETESYNQTQGQAMPVLNSAPENTPQYTGVNTVVNTGVNTEENGQNSAQQSSSQGTRTNGAPQSQNPASPQPIIINIHNSQDTASNNRSLFAPKVNDESRKLTRLNVGSERDGHSFTAQADSETPISNTPVPIIKTPLPSTTPGASLDQQRTSAPDPLPSNSQSSDQEPPSTQAGQTAASSDNQSRRPRYVLMRHGKLLHLRPVDAVIAEQDQSVSAAPTASSPAPRASNRNIHYVGWS